MKASKSATKQRKREPIYILAQLLTVQLMDKDVNSSGILYVNLYYLSGMPVHRVKSAQ
jgi:hypothetical protein